MKVIGNGQSGMAIVLSRLTAGEKYSGQPWLEEPLLRHVVKVRAQREQILRIVIEPEDKEDSLWPVLQKHFIRSVLTVGTPAFKYCTRRLGSEFNYAGSVIERQGVYFVPVIPRYNLQTLEKPLYCSFIQRCWDLRQSSAKPFKWSKLSFFAPNEETIADLEGILERRNPIGLDIETAGIDILKVPITAIGVGDDECVVSVPWEAYVAGKYGLVYDIRSTFSGTKAYELILKILKSGQTKILHNGQYDLLGLQKRNIEVSGNIEDTLLLHRVIYPERKHNLQAVAVGEFPVEPWKADYKKRAKDYIDTDPVALRLYNSKDTAVLPFLLNALKCKLLAVYSGQELYDEYRELSIIAGGMQRVGFALDTARVNEINEELKEKGQQLAEKWATLSDVSLGKVGQGPKLREFFFNELKAPVVAFSKKSKKYPNKPKKPSLPSSALLEYVVDPKLRDYAKTLFEFRKIKKLETAFIQPMLGKDRIHTTFKVWGTKGSRWSASNPNLQQMSKEKEIIYCDGEAKKLIPPLRDVLIADPGYVLIEADYSALELRMVAHVAQMYEVLGWLLDGKDPHLMNARRMFDRPNMVKTDVLRQITKTLTFALFYNYFQKVETVYKNLKASMPDLTLRELKKIQERFYKARPELPIWQQSVISKVVKLGYVEAPISKRRWVMDKNKPELNLALNFPIQSSAGDLMNRALIEFDKEVKGWANLPDFGHFIFSDTDSMRRQRGELTTIKAQIHDALIIQCRPQDVEYNAQLLKSVMERPIEINEKLVSFPVELKSGLSWGQMTDL